jgi:hypothetical protein
MKPQMHKPNRLWKRLSVIGDSWETRPTLAVDDFQVLQGAATRRRGSQCDPAKVLELRHLL